MTYIYYKNGTYESLGHGIGPEGYSFDEWLESIKERAFISTALISTGEQPLNITEAVELGRSVAEVYVGAFVVEAPSRSCTSSRRSRRY